MEPITVWGSVSDPIANWTAANAVTSYNAYLTIHSHDFQIMNQHVMDSTKYAGLHVHTDPGLLNDPQAAELVKEIDNQLITLQMEARSWPDTPIFTMPGQPPLTGQQMLQFMDKINITVTNTLIPQGAITQPDSLDAYAANFNITFSMSSPALQKYADPANFGSQARGFAYMVAHELGHALSPSLNWIINNAGYGSDHQNNPLIEAYANTVGYNLYTNNGQWVGDMPSKAEIESVNHSQFVDEGGFLPDQTAFIPLPTPTFSDAGSTPTLFMGNAGTIDTVNFSIGTAGVQADMSPQAMYSYTKSAYISVENLVGTNYNDTLIGSSDNNTFSGQTGNDSITGGEGDDRLQGNAGNDTVQGGQGSDFVYGGQGDDVVRGGAGDDYVSGDVGNDSIWGDLGNNTLVGGAGADVFNVSGAGGWQTITDFNSSEGDRIHVESGSYSLSQSGADVIMNFGNGIGVTIKNVTVSSLGSNWLV